MQCCTLHDEFPGYLNTMDDAMLRLVHATHVTCGMYGYMQFLHDLKSELKPMPDPQGLSRNQRNAGVQVRDSTSWLLGNTRLPSRRCASRSHETRSQRD